MICLKSALKCIRGSFSVCLTYLASKYKQTYIKQSDRFVKQDEYNKKQKAGITCFLSLSKPKHLEVICLLR